MRRGLTLILAVSLLTIIAASVARAENWPCWRGPRGDGTSLETSAPTTWSATDNIAWSVATPGRGHASPIVWQDRIFLVTCLEDSQERVLLCYDRTNGKLLWRQVVLQSPLERKHNLNSFASSTPATDGQRVYISFLQADESDTKQATPGDMVVAAYDLDGHQQWMVRPGRFSSVHGYCSSPVLFDDKVIINGDHDGEAYLVALDRATGATKWKTPRENNTRSYTTPIVREIDGRTQMIMAGNKCVASYDPHDGSQHWIIDGPTEQFVASMVFNGKLLFMTAGFPEHHILAIRPDGHGNVTRSAIAWRTKESTAYVPSPIAAGEYFLLTSDEGICSCFEADSGKRLWKERLGRHYSGSPVLINGLVYFTADDGVTKIVRPGPKLDIVATNQIDEYTFASPAVSQGQIFIRGEKHLFAIGK